MKTYKLHQMCFVMWMHAHLVMAVHAHSITWGHAHSIMWDHAHWVTWVYAHSVLHYSLFSKEGFEKGFYCVAQAALN